MIIDDAAHFFYNIWVWITQKTITWLKNISFRFFQKLFFDLRRRAGTELNTMRSQHKISMPSTNPNAKKRKTPDTDIKVRGVGFRMSDAHGAGLNHLILSWSIKP